MATTYAGVLGPLSFCVVVARGLIDRGDLGSTMWDASVCLFAFAAIGYVIGRLAAWTVKESVQAKINAELAAETGPTQTTETVSSDESPAA